MSHKRELEPSFKLLFERGRWQICENKRGVWVWHRDCPKMPSDQIGRNQECWLIGDSVAECIVCEKPVPAEILALVMLYTNAV